MQRALFFLFAFSLAGLGSPRLFAQPKTVTVPGLSLTEFPRLPEQDRNENVFQDPTKFGQPIGKVTAAKSLHPLSWNPERNAIARATLKIEKDGDYQFNADSYFDRNLLMIDGEVVCDFRDGPDAIQTVTLKKGTVELCAVGFVESRGKLEIQWRPPGQRELSAIPLRLLSHQGIPEPPKGITIVAKDFVIEVYHNGERVPEAKRKFLLDRFGATAERIDAELHPGDWIVFHVANNRLRHKGTKYFAMAATVDGEPFAHVSDFNSPQWSSCDDPGRVDAFIKNRLEGTESRAVPIARPWEEGLKFMRKYAGEEFPGKPIWGTAPSTWLKFVVPDDPAKPEPAKIQNSPRRTKLPPPDAIFAFQDLGASLKLVKVPPLESNKEAEKKSEEKEEPLEEVTNLPLAIESPRKWPVQVLSAVYGTGGKNADVTERVAELVQERKFFAANPGHLKADPNPYWNKSLRIVYMKDGVRREQRRNENEHILPESFYGPQDAGELETWLPGTRWIGPRGEIQFHQNQLLTGPELKTQAQWKATAANGLEITWEEDDVTAYRFDYTWSSFKQPDDAKTTHRILK